MERGFQVLEFVAIQRRDTGAWAIPGGMVDPGERVSVTVKREFMEEALDSTGAARGEADQLAAMVDKFFEGGEEVYRSGREELIIVVADEELCRGYVDDPRNTDNAWMETVAFSFHDPSGQEVAPPPSSQAAFLRSAGCCCRPGMTRARSSGCHSVARWAD